MLSTFRKFNAGLSISGTSDSKAEFTAVSQLLKIKLHVLQVRGYRAISLEEAFFLEVGIFAELLSDLFECRLGPNNFLISWP